MEPESEGTLLRTLSHWATVQPNHPFLVEAESGETLTYGQTYAALWQARHFLGDEPRQIALALPGGIANAVLWLTALTGGHTLIPVSPSATNQEFARIGSLYAPDVLAVEHVDVAERFGRSEAVVAPRHFWEAMIRAAKIEATRPMPARQGTVCLETSGSTGEPKGVILTERQIAWTAEQICRSHQLNPADRGLAVLPFFHVNAPVVSLCASLIAGSSVVIAPRFSLSHFWDWVSQYEITWASIVPTILALLLRAPKPKTVPAGLRFVRTASAPLPAAHLSLFERQFGVPVIETYGLTEAASQVCANPLPPERHIPGSVGRPTGVTLRVCRTRSEEIHTSELLDVAQGEIGELCVAGPSVVSGYARGVGEGAFVDGWFRTGDLGYQDTDGYVYITGRLRDVIIRGGENIAPREIEEVLLTCPDVTEVAVIGRPDPIYGEEVVAFVAFGGQRTGDVTQRLHNHCAAHLSAYKMPTTFIEVEALPRTASGKVDRQRLRQTWDADSLPIYDNHVA